MRKLLWLILILIPVAIFGIPIWLAGWSIDGALVILRSWAGSAFNSVAPAFMTLPYWPAVLAVSTLIVGFGLGVFREKLRLFMRWGSRGTQIISGGDKKPQTFQNEPKSDGLISLSGGQQTQVALAEKEQQA